MFLILGCVETFLDKVWPVTIKVDSFFFSKWPCALFCVQLPVLNLQPTGWASLLKFDLSKLNLFLHLSSCARHNYTGLVSFFPFSGTFQNTCHHAPRRCHEAPYLFSVSEGEGRQMRKGPVA